MHVTQFIVGINKDRHGKTVARIPQRISSTSKQAALSFGGVTVLDAVGTYQQDGGKAIITEFSKVFLVVSIAPRNRLLDFADLLGREFDQESVLVIVNNVAEFYNPGYDD